MSTLPQRVILGQQPMADQQRGSRRAVCVPMVQCMGRDLGPWSLECVGGLMGQCSSNPAWTCREVAPGVVEFEVAVPRLTPAFR
jgi:hypothetical protein